VTSEAWAALDADPRVTIAANGSCLNAGEVDDERGYGA
jgi:hypothetical protein